MFNDRCYTVFAWIGLVLLVALIADQVRAAEPIATLALVNGEVVTLDRKNTVATAVAISGDEIMAVGDDDTIRKMVDSQTTVLDLNGACVIPGFVEGHGHFMSLGFAKMNLELQDCKSWEEVAAKVADAAKLRGPGQWIVGRGWHQEKWNRVPSPNVEGYPVHQLITQAAPKNPVVLSHGSGHMAIANQAALALAGITASTPNPSGGEILHDRDGKPTGVLRESAQDLAWSAVTVDESERTPERRVRETRQAFQLATQECLENGITTFHDAGISFAEIDQLQSLNSQGLFKLRLHVMVNSDNDQLARWLPDYRTKNIRGKFLVVRGIKRMIDGALGSHGAWLLEPYRDKPESSGLNLDSLDGLKETAALAARHRYQLCVHAIGDRANREVLNVYQNAQALVPAVKSLRWRIEHAQHIHPDDIPRFAELNVLASMQGIHCTSDAPFVVTRLGKERSRQGAYAWRSLTDAGATIVNGTDAPVEDPSPIACFHATVTRRPRNGEPFYPEQCLTRLEALATYTRNGAFAGFRDRFSGTIEAGKEADIVVLSNNLLTCGEEDILKTNVLKTIVGGRIVFESASQK